LPVLFGVGGRDPAAEIAFDCDQVNERSIQVPVYAAWNEEPIFAFASHTQLDARRMAQSCR
jgi:hypothetical protein